MTSQNFFRWSSCAATVWPLFKTVPLKLINPLTDKLYSDLLNDQIGLYILVIFQMLYHNVNILSIYQLTNAIQHSLKPTNGLPHDGPLGLKVHLSEPEAVIQGTSSTYNYLNVPGASDIDSFTSCEEITITSDMDSDYCDTVESPSFHDRRKKPIDTWL